MFNQSSHLRHKTSSHGGSWTRIKSVCLIKNYSDKQEISVIKERRRPMSLITHHHPPVTPSILSVPHQPSLGLQPACRCSGGVTPDGKCHTAITEAEPGPEAPLVCRLLAPQPPGPSSTPAMQDDRWPVSHNDMQQNAKPPARPLSEL